MTRPVVGIAGATGAVGTALAEHLAARGIRLRLGARRADHWPYDVRDPAPFCAGCDVVVDCVGPLAPDRTALAEAAHAAGACLVDPGGDEDLRQRLADLWRTSSCAVLQAGAVPGLSGLVPRWLALAGLPPPWRLTGYVSTVDRLTPASALDFVHSLADDAPSGGSAPHRVELFDEPGVAYPYRGDESDRLAHVLNLAEVRWHHVFAPDGHLLPTLIRCRTRYRAGVASRTLAEDLCRAAALDAFGRAPHQRLVVELTDGTRSRVGVVRARGTYALTAAVATLAVDRILAGDVPAGVHYAADVLDPSSVPGLRDAPGVESVSRVDGPLWSSADVEQGVL